MSDLDERLDAIDSALDDDEIDVALGLVREALKAYPDDPDLHMRLGDVRCEDDDVRGAHAAFQTATKLAPEAPEPWESLAWMDFALLDFDAAHRAATRANTLGDSPGAWALLGRLAERDDRMDEADRCARRAHKSDAEAYPLPYRISEAEFRDTVAEALDRLPEEFHAALEGEVAVLVQPVPPLDVLRSDDPPLDPELLGLYTGTPLPERDSLSTSRLPDVVYLFHHNLEHVAESREELVEEIAVTVFHEIGHYLGYDDDELEERGFA